MAPHRLSPFLVALGTDVPVVFLPGIGVRVMAMRVAHQETVV
jgi:hypothetical protein